MCIVTVLPMYYYFYYAYSRCIFVLEIIVVHNNKYYTVTIQIINYGYHCILAKTAATIDT